MNKKTGNTHLLSNVLVILGVALFWIVLGAFNVFTKLDYRIYDFLLGLKSNPPSVDNFVFVNIDDQSINEMGEWPWSRDILADGLVRMKELGAQTAVFDVEYLSVSPLGVDPDSIEKTDNAFKESQQSIEESINYFTNAALSGMYSKSEILDISNEILNQGVNPVFSNLFESVTENMYRDNDDYFARAIQFFGNTYLTVNTHDVAIETKQENIDYAVNRFLFNNVTDSKNRILKSNDYTFKDEGRSKGFTPALHNLLTHSKGMGFTNIIIDSDGTRRRVELFTEFNQKYIGQLVFAPLMANVKPTEFIRKANKLIVKNAMLPNEKQPKDIIIPLDKNGRMLINWLHEDFAESFKSESAMFLAELDFMENNITQQLDTLSKLPLLKTDGTLLDSIQEALILDSEYENIKRTKDSLLLKCKGYSESGEAIDGGLLDSDYDDYFLLRNKYYENVKKYLHSDFKTQIINYYENVKTEENVSEIDSTLNAINEIFDVLENQYNLYTEYFEEMKKVYSGAFCIIGNTASSTTDMGATPFIRSYFNVGTHANVYNTIMKQSFITPIDWKFSVLFAIFLSLLTVFLSKYASFRMQNITGVLGILLFSFTIIALMVFFGIYIPSMAALLIVIFSYIADLIFRFISTEKEKSFIRHAFSTYVSGSIVDEIVDDPERLKLGGEEKHITALFSDIKNFSAFSEMVTPTKLVAILNQYLGTLSDVILSEKGTIDKYIGDAIVSFFGAPLNLPNHAWYACSAAIKMKQAEAEFNRKHLADGDIPRSLETRIGINTGDMVVGNMGTNMKLNYTIMGNDVNLASRLEGVNKAYKSWILTSEQTWSEADSGEHNGSICARRFDKVRVVGIEKPVQLYNILGFKSDMAQNEIQAVDVFHEALDLYFAKEFTKAEKLFKQAHKINPLDDSPLVFAERAASCASSGVPKDWDGVMNMKSK